VVIDTDSYSVMLTELERQRTELDRARSSLAELTSRAVSADRLVSVTVNARGLPVDISIEPIALRRYRADALSTLLTDLAGQADEALRTRRAAILEAAAAPQPTLADLRELLRDSDND